MSERGTLLRGLASYHLTLGAIQPESAENTVKDLWQVITSVYFPFNENYRVDFFANDTSASVFQIIPAAKNPNPEQPEDWVERQILQVEFRRPSVDNPANWQSMTEAGFHQQLAIPSNDNRKSFGAVAVGKKVKFFRCDGARVSVPLHQDPISLDAQEESSQLQSVNKQTASPLEPFAMSKPGVQPTVAFISGPIDTSANAAYFHTHYKPQIDVSIAAGHSFVIGPLTSGVDADALSYLLDYPVPPSRITIFMTIAEDSAWGEQFRRRGVNVHVLEDITATSQNRDAAMTEASDYDILRWRTEGEAKEFYGTLYRPGHLTNTERNWRRRRGISFLDVLTEEDYARHSYTHFADGHEPTRQEGGRFNCIKDKLKRDLQGSV
ncbi:hypothetical protein BJX76DRAFT_357699 [Aspergillus varians]